MIQIQKINNKIVVRIPVQNAKQKEIDYTLKNQKIRFVFVLPEIYTPNEENIIEKEYDLIFEYEREERKEDILYVYLKQIPTFTESFDFGCVTIKNIKAKFQNETIHLGYIKEKTNKPEHEFKFLNGKVICKHCGFEAAIIDKQIKELDENYHEIIYKLENGQELKKRESHNEECFGKCYAEETQELVSILEKVQFTGSKLIHPEFKVDLNPKKSSSLEFNSLEDYYYIDETIKYRPIFIEGNENLYSRMKELIHKLRKILEHSKYEKFVKIFAGC